MKSVRLIPVSLSIILIVLMLPMSNMIPLVKAQLNLPRQVTILVKVILVGIDPEYVNTTYVTWAGNLPTTTEGQVLEPPPGGTPTGVVYNVSYSFMFASNDFKTKLETYLQSIQEVKNTTNPWFYYYTMEPNGYVSTTNYYSVPSTFYDANKVENWLYSNQQDLGGFPSNGWTLMLLNLPELPSLDFKDYSDFLRNQRTMYPNGTEHYYSIVDQDTDLGYQWKTLGPFMTGWGGVHRFWFNDLSAGPSFWTYPEDLPLQIALPDNKIELNSSFGRTWFTEYIADYISQATWNFVTPFFEYDPIYSQSYSFHIHVFDNRTLAEKNRVDIKSTVDPEKIKYAFKDLLPYSNVSVSLAFEDLSSYPGLQQVIDSNYKYTDSFTYGVSGQPLQYWIVDARPVYDYIESNIDVFEPKISRDRSEFTVPVFAFAFANDTLFTFTSKWSIAKQESGIKALLGVALGDIALVSVSQQEFARGDYVTPPEPGKGEGFTEVIIHESGHMLGLPHPHNFGPVGDFTLTVMGYYTYDYVFGQSDKDALRRAHVDQVYMEVQSMLQRIGLGSPGAGSVRDQLGQVDREYSQMDYVGALSTALKAEEAARTSILTSLVMLLQPLTYVVAGLIIGFVVAWVMLRRRRALGTGPYSTPTITSPTRIIPRPAYG
jgi:membrane protease YdiL (CAAX protease family)